MKSLLSADSKALLKSAADAIAQGRDPFAQSTYDDYCFLSQQIADILNGFLESPDLVQNTVLIVAEASPRGITGKRVFDLLQLHDQPEKVQEALEQKALLATQLTNYF